MWYICSSKCLDNEAASLTMDKNIKTNIFLASLPKTDAKKKKRWLADTSVKITQNQEVKYYHK